MELQLPYKFVNAKRLTNEISKSTSKLIVQKLRNMNSFMSHAFFSLLCSKLRLMLITVATQFGAVPFRLFGTLLVVMKICSHQCEKFIRDQPRPGLLRSNKGRNSCPGLGWFRVKFSYSKFQEPTRLPKLKHCL